MAEISDKREFLPVNIAVLTVSDTRTLDDDRSGDMLADRLDGAGHVLAAREIVKDDIDAIAAKLTEYIENPEIDVVITTGGTGPSGRDVTPEATEAVCEKMMPGFGELMRKVSLEKVATAILSRQTAGIRGSSLIVNLPGQPKAIRECLDAVFPAIPYCIDLIGGPYLEGNPDVVKIFRPVK